MASLLIATLGVAALLGAGTPPAADSCRLARARLDEYLIQLPRACRQSADCDGYYYRADPCSPAVVLARPGATTSREPRLLLLQDTVRKACGAQLSQHAACSPTPYRAVCRASRCEDAGSAKEVAPLSTPPLPAAPRHFRHAVITHTCAPWDGPALALLLSDTAGCAASKGPHIQVSLWRDLPPKAGTTINFSVRDSNGQASRCLEGDECEAATSGSVVFDIVDEGKKARGRYELRFKDGSIESGGFEAEWCENRGFCGMNR